MTSVVISIDDMIYHLKLLVMFTDMFLSFSKPFLYRFIKAVLFIIKISL